MPHGSATRFVAVIIVVCSVSDRCRSQSRCPRTIADLVACPTGEIVDHRDPDRIHLDPGVPAARRVSGGCSFDDEPFDPYRGREHFEPLGGLVDVIGDGRQLKRRDPALGQLLQALRRTVQCCVRKSTPPTASTSNAA